MSEDTKIGEASVEAAQGYTSMSDAYAPPEEKKKTYDAQEGGIREAAEDLAATRAKAEDEPIPRTYVEHGGDHHGEAVAGNETISLERASVDLTRQRAVEQAAQQPDPQAAADAVDALRAQATQQPQPQPEPQPQPQLPEQQAQQVDGVDPEIAQALQNPKIREALAREVEAAENARQQFAQQALDAARLSAASLFSFAPELASLTTEQLPGALALIAKSNPQRAMEIQAQLSRTEQLFTASRQAEAQAAATRQHQQQQQLKAWAAQQDEVFEREVASKESPARMQEITENVVALAEEYGVSREELVTAWKSQPVLRSAAFQRMMVDAAKYRMAQKAVPAKVARPVPPVQRPGIAPPHGSSSDVDSLIKQFRSAPSVDNAVQLLMARRASNRR